MSSNNRLNNKYRRTIGSTTMYRNVVINQSIIDKLPNHDVPERLWATMQISDNVETAANERANYIHDLLINVSESNNTVIVPLIPSAVLDVNGTNISSDDVVEHLLDRMKLQTAEQTRALTSERNIQKDTVYMIPRGIFPTLFQYGCGAIEDGSRSVKIDFREHLTYLLSLEDHRFEEHYSFIFVVINILQRRIACIHAHFMTSRPYFWQSSQLL
ncbi:unnamed protein product [Rotaria magnacalcarata]|uniref:Uncharacterized protein n=2 Tax=Rotaria magnacalcarata TaxID=392030 RepID=A0A819PIQ4_9BILA|nr:unnamed protein product [Rotaria magnacalcarata]